jgi:predicted DNA-binding protein
MADPFWAEMHRRFPTVTVRVPRKTFDRLDERSAQLNKSRSGLARDFVEHCLDMLDNEEVSV